MTTETGSIRKARHFSAWAAAGAEVALLAAFAPRGSRMSPRIPAESRMVAAFVAAAIALAFVAFLVIANVRVFIADDRRVDDWLRDERVLSKLSSTTDDAARTDERSALTKHVQEWLAQA